MPRTGNRPIIDLAWKRSESLKVIVKAEQVEGKRSKTLFALLQNLESFTDEFYDFFRNGFSGKGSYAFQPSDEYPYETISRIISDQIGRDLDVINRAVALRQRYTELGNAKDQQIAKALDIADQLAFAALVPAIVANLVPGDTTVVAYLEERATIRVIPYAPVALIGLPFTVITDILFDKAQASDEIPFQAMLAIPHEVGHYVYWHAPLTTSSANWHAAMRRHFENKPTWLQNWLEEIFADVYACLVAGPVVALNFQPILLTNTTSGLLYDDGVHPVSALRGYIYADIIRTLGWSRAADELEAQWTAWLSSRTSAEQFQPLGAAKDEFISFDKARSLVDEVVKALLLLDLHKLLPTDLRNTKATTENPSAENPDARNLDTGNLDTEKIVHTPWTGELSPVKPTNLKQLYDIYETFSKNPLKKFQLNQVPDYPTSQNGVSSIGDSQQTEKGFSWFNDFRSQLTKSALPFQVPSSVWLAALTSLGWITGPGDVPIPKK